MRFIGHIAGTALALSACMGLPTAPDSTERMRADVTKLIEAAQKRTTLWPWVPAESEVAHVAGYGRTVAPLLLAQLVDDPDNSPGVNWNVQQHVALALCKIYGVEEASGHVFMNRAPREHNASVKSFWSRKVAEQ